WVPIEVSLLRTHVSDMDRLPGSRRAGQRAIRDGTVRSAPLLRCECRWHRAVDGNATEEISLTEPQSAVAGFAQPRPIREDGLEYGVEVGWGTADDTEDLGASCLALKRLAQLAGGGLQLAGGRRLLRDRLVELAGQQCICLLEAGNGSDGIASFRGRGTARRLSRAAPLRLGAARSTSCHPIPLTG